MQTFSETKWQVQSSWLINDDVWVDPGSGGQVPCSFIYSPAFWPHGQWTRTHWAAWGVTESHQYNRLQNLQTFLHDSPRPKLQWNSPASRKRHEKTKVGMPALAISTFGAFLKFWSFLHFCQIIFELRLITVTRYGFSLSPFLCPISFSQMV